MESLTAHYEDSNKVLGRVNGLVVWFGSPEVSYTVDGPGCIQGNDISESIAKYVRVQEVLISKVPWDEHRKNHIEKVT